MTTYAHPMRSFFNHKLFMIAALAAFTSSGAHADPLGAGSGTLYSLSSTSSLQEGCLPPCLCPILTSDGVRGTFLLVYNGNVAGTETYAVRDVNWTASVGGVRVDIAGEGVYRIGSPSPLTVLEQSLELELVIGDEPAQHFESGWVPLGNLNGIRIAIAMNGFYCWDRVFEIAAERAVTDRMVKYTVANGATFQQGCFDPCDCPLEAQRPLIGTFTLLPMGDAVPTTEFAVVDIKWQALGATVADTIPIHGHGFYRIGGALAPEQQLSLSLVVGDRPRQRYGSGAVPGGGFPHIDATISMNGIVCDDVVMHVIADPNAGLCGGIAGLPCGPGEFCKLAPGNCCCDYFGICAPLPDACLTVFDPVCGCDGVTYPSQCDADAAGVSIEHRGACNPSACCFADGTCANLGPQSCQIEGGEAVAGVLCDPLVCVRPITGACCLSGATGTLVCDELTAEMCAGAGGTYAGDGTTCPTDPNSACPPPPGACCLPDGACIELPSDVCFGAGGEPFSGAPCNPILCVPVATGACCIKTSSGAVVCAERTAQRCEAENGHYGGDGSVCPNDLTTPCPVDPGACCFADGACVGDLTMEQCVASGGEPLPGTACSTGLCVPVITGACCLPNAAGSLFCLEVSADRCINEGGDYAGDGTFCPDDPTLACQAPPSACCLPDGNCMELSTDVCLGASGEPVPGVPCSPVLCSPVPTGACCFDDPANGVAFCAELSVERCAFEGGNYAGDGTTCPTDPNEACPVALGACCLPDGNCLDNLPADLCVGAGGEPLPGAVCSPLSCVPPITGACCFSDPIGFAFCLDLTGESCLAEGGSYAGDGTTCQLGTADPCPAPKGACCLPDGSCLDIPSDVCLGAGGDPLPGVACATVFCTADPVGACCLDSTLANLNCFVGTALECENEAGAYQGDDTFCPADPAGPCPEPTGACCLSAVPGTPIGGCAVTTAPRCLGDGGTYLGDDTVCPTDNTLPCEPATGACCLADATGAQICLDGLSAERCLAEGGTYSGDNTTCPADPATACPSPCDIACPGSDGCFRGCGSLSLSFDCILFSADSGEEFSIPNFGPFVVGDRVFLSGCVDTQCADPCAGANGCLSVFNVQPCEQVCGGIAGIPCSGANEFCKFPGGTCNIADNQGVCEPLPNVCPDIYAPVCGCDGITYGNECESDAAGVSIDHRGECGGDSCPAARVLTSPDLSYCPSSPKLVEINLNLLAGTSAIALEDAPPAGWSVSQISDGGVLDVANGKVKWGPFFAPFPPSVSYLVTPDADIGQACFLGTISIDGTNQIVCGDRCVDACCPHIAADLPRAACAACNTNGCQTCDSSCQDGEVSLCELGSYACEWITGCHDDLAGMTRSAFLWRNGECYCYDSQGQNWRPSACSPDASVCCSDANAAPGVTPAAAVGAGRSAITLVRPSGRFKRTRSRIQQVEVLVSAPVGTMAVGVEIDVPAGWDILSISDGGTWDTTHNKIKWGPWMDTLSRTVTFRARATEVMEGRVRRIQSVGKAASFTGTVSFDGVNQAMVIERK